ncbi:hypothetical protein [Mycobacterium aquaticum]|uniref:hypothetical protein n=1 Tax=Mycobacterium aquaticum TaxID=1927124 RepID=UPI001301EF6A|nr:hypothetical protein [Mycobacterium aquaticum]
MEHVLGLTYSVVSQHFRKEHGDFKPDQLVTLYIGTNDVALKNDPRFDPKLAAVLRAVRIYVFAAANSSTLACEVDVHRGVLQYLTRSHCGDSIGHRRRLRAGHRTSLPNRTHDAIIDRPAANLADDDTVTLAL